MPRHIVVSEIAWDLRDVARPALTHSGTAEVKEWAGNSRLARVKGAACDASASTSQSQCFSYLS
jgi:hypothetical protein